ncbi:putative patatin-like phospholipase domain-containing protein [Neospora caninum Liverpool]|uniref:Putative patatin-like phospholipase domain-containing protein n=1 Tax=Neospora caninum (strain Liverpool) TaxID=572307 RepID=F0V9H7_NEOCL|nr:putative patatin-like phospholipase domain-containing protein [Neospora caninum Liverpool]CBZ50402.1 putative patatin-like phospholipase domain-containing protein [Neospora caninum Liverpool]|eukprot:XP_003880436.1 putative patatin-like phospholipase domain-containing protein [Neospora caninum Liverpool]
MAASFCPEIRPPSQRGSTELQSSSSHSPRSSSISSSLSFSSPSSSPSFASTAFPQPPDDRGISISRGRGKNKRIGAQEAEGRKGQNRPAGSPRSPVATLESGMSFSQSSPSDSTAPAASEGEDGKAKQTSRRRKTHSRSSPIIFPVPVSPPGSLSAASSGFNCTHERPWGRETCSPAATPCVSLVDRLLSKSSQEILLSVPGYYALCVANKTDSSWDGLFMGLAQMRIVCEYSLSPPTFLKASFSPFMEDVLSAGSRRDPRKCPDQTRVSRRQDASLLMRHSQVSSPPVTTIRSFMLTLDSSGVLTYTSLLILRRLEQEVQFHLGDETVHLASCFDLVAGSGFGGLVALGLLRGLTPSQMLTAWTGAEDDDACGEEPGDFLQTLLREGCMRSRVQQLLVEHLGEQFLNTFSSPPYCLVTAADVLKHPHEVFVLRSYEHMHPAVHAHAYRGTAHVPLWIAGWATCADGAQIKAMSKNDFSLLGYRLEPAVQLQQKTPSTSNPTLLALEEMSRLSGKSLSSFIQENLQLLVSIGTGKGADGSDSFFRGDGSRLHRGDKRGDIAHAWSKRNHIHREVLHWLSDTQNMYYRLNPPHLAHCNPQFMDSRQREYVRAATESYLVDDKFFDVKVMSRLLAYRVLALREKGRDAAAARPRCTPPWAGGPTAKVFPIAHVARSQS